MIIMNPYLRLFFGLSWIIFGLVCLKIYYDRDKNNKWGTFFRKLAEPRHWDKTGINSEWIMLFLGWLGIIGGIIAILFGFRLTL